MSRKTVLYFEDDDGYGRVARDRASRVIRGGDGYEHEIEHDYLVIERYRNGSWVEDQKLGDYTDPGDLEVPKP